MTILLHGDDIVRSRRRLTEIQASFPTQNGPLFTDQPIPEVIWEGKKLSAAQVAKLRQENPELTVEEFALAPIVFKFVEAIRPGNQKEMLTLWRQYLTREEPEMAMAMICRQFRLMTSEGDKLAPWQKNKIESQKKRFGEEKLKRLYGELLEIDYQTKSGRTPFPLALRLELWLLSL